MRRPRPLLRLPAAEGRQRCHRPRLRPQRSTCQTTPSFAAARQPTRPAWSSSTPSIRAGIPGEPCTSTSSCRSATVRSPVSCTSPSTSTTRCSPGRRTRSGQVATRPTPPTRFFPPAAPRPPRHPGCPRRVPSRRVPPAPERVVSGPVTAADAAPVADTSDHPLAACVEVTESRESRVGAFSRAAGASAPRSPNRRRLVLPRPHGARRRRRAARPRRRTAPPHRPADRHLAARRRGAPPRLARH